MNPSLNRGASLFVSSSLALALLSFVFGPVSLGELSVVGDNSWRVFGIFAVAVFLICGCSKLSGAGCTQLSIERWPFFLAFLLLLLSDYPERSYGYFSHPFSWHVYSILIAFTCAILVFLPHLTKIRIECWFIIALVLVAAAFLNEVQGKMIFSDDHPSFFYRLSLLKEFFPHIPFYNPQWNAGYSAREFFATGALNIFLLSLPALKLGLLDNPANYSLLVGAISILVLPISVYLSMRVLKFEGQKAVLGGILALCPSLDLFEWLLRYGTLGFVLSASLIPLLFSLTFRLLFSGDRLGSKGFAALLLVSTLCFFWTLSVVVFVPSAVVLLAGISNFIKEGRVKKAVLFIALFLALNGVWLTTFIRESKVSKFVTNASLPGAAKKAEKPTPSMMDIHKKSKELQSKINPIVLFFAIPGLFLLRDRRLVTVFGLTIVWLFLLSTVGDFIKPQFEFRRMNLLACLLLIPLAANGIIAFLEKIQGEHRGYVRIAGLSLLFPAMAIAPLNASAIYSNRSDIHFRYASPDIWSLAELIKLKSGDGRTFFLGFVLHELGASANRNQDGGHLAPLALWSGHELFASHYFHARWSAIDPIPADYRKRGKDGIEEFLNLMNATSVIAFRKEWIDFCTEDSRYVYQGMAGTFKLFKRSHYQPNPVLEGSASEFHSEGNHISLRPESERIVLKNRYFPRLISNYPETVKIKPYHLFNEALGKDEVEPFDFIELNIAPQLIKSGAKLKIGY